MRPRISIITPVINGERYIAGCLQNVIDQGVAGIEQIVVDGGSTDNTLSIIGDYQKRHSHIQLIPGPDKGQSDAMNKGIRAAKAPVISILNSDDFYEPTTLSDALSIIELQEAPIFIVGDTRVVDQSGDTLYWNRPWDLRLESLVLGAKYTASPYNPSAYFYHKEIHEIVGYYDVSDHQIMDTAFIFNCARAGIRMRYFGRHWGNFRLIPGTKTYIDQSTGAGKARADAFNRRYVSEFTLRQKCKMYMILGAKMPRKLAATVLMRSKQQRAPMGPDNQSS